MAVELIGGYTGFVDESLVDHTTIGGAVRVPVSRRLSVGPEVVYMIGPGGDRDLFVTGLLTFDIVGSAVEDRAPRIVPFLAIGGGIFRHSDTFGPETFSSWEGAVTGGGGIRVALTPRVSVGADVRIGWETHLRVNGLLAIARPRCPARGWEPGGWDLV
jgi:hypothetical protein